MIESSDSKEVKEDYLAILKNILDKIKKAAKTSGYQPSNDISIQVGTSTFYRSSNRQNLTEERLNPQIVEAIQKAIKNPEESKGSIKIKIGKENVYSVTNGKVLIDKLGIYQCQKQAPLRHESTQVKSIEDLDQQIEKLGQKLQAQQELIHVLKSQSQVQKPENISSIINEIDNLKKAVVQQQNTLEKLSQGLEIFSNRSTPEIKNTKLQNFVGSLESNVKKIATSLYTKATTLIAPKVEKARSQISQLEIESQIRDLKSHLSQKIDDGFSDITSVVKDLKSEAVQSLNDGFSNIKSVAEDLKSETVQKLSDGLSNITSVVKNLKTEAVENFENSVYAINSSEVEAKEKNIISSAKYFVEQKGERNLDGSITLDTANYSFSQNQGNLSIISKQDERVIVQNNAFTCSMKLEDFKILETIPPLAEELSKNIAKTQTLTTTFKR